MSTDRELLELAAKAAGICLVWNDAEKPGYYSEWSGLPQWEEWDPLADDGDVMRLLLKISNTHGRTTEVVISGGISRVRIRDFNHGWEYCGIERHHDDHGAATRRAIICAVAEIGRGMK